MVSSREMHPVCLGVHYSSLRSLRILTRVVQVRPRTGSTDTAAWEQISAPLLRLLDQTAFQLDL